jgi:branched-chain amino acid transport system permease protein
VLLADYLTSSGFHGIDLVTGSVFILVVLLFRRGVWGTVRHLWLIRRQRRMAKR